MRSRHFGLAGLLVLSWFSGLPEAPAQWIPPGGISLLPDDPLAAATLVGQTGLANGVERFTLRAPQTAKEKALPFAQAIRVRTFAQGDHDWDLQIHLPITGQVGGGETLFLVFYARNASGDVTGGTPAQSASTLPQPTQARLTAVIQGNPPGYPTPLEVPLRAGPEWTRYAIPVTTNLPGLGGRAFAPGEGHVLFRLGSQRQTVELGGFELVDYGSHPPSLPKYTVTYPGREADAAWRKEAEARIEKLRKGDFTLALVDAAGKPLPGATVDLKLRRHAFGFGTAVAAEQLPLAGPDADKYRETLARLFDLAVIENHLKWESWDNPPQRKLGLDAVAWLNAQGIPVRGHNLVWPNWPYLPASLKALANEPDALRATVEKHVTDETTRLKGQVFAWDVLNEPLLNHALQDLLGPDVVNTWFALAHQADPAAKLYVNEALDFGSPTLPRLEALVRQLKSANAPLDAVGLQCHYGWDLTPPQEVLATLDRFERIGLPVTVTEFDLNVDDEALQADYTRDLLTAVFSHPDAKGFLVWGFWEGRDWIPRVALFRRDWTPKPNGLVWEEMTRRHWTTAAHGATAKDGTMKFRGFYGTYELVVTREGKTTSLPVTFTADGVKATTTIP